VCPAQVKRLVESSSSLAQVKFELFKSMVKSWDKLCAEAAAFASEKGRERLITIAVSGNDSSGLVVVWYCE
jgi:hypothetical protein